MSYLKKAVKSTIIIYIFIALGALFAYILRILLASQLSPQEFGLFYAVYAFIAFFSTFKSLGYGFAIIRYIPEFKVKNQNEEIKSSLVLSILVQLLFSFVLIIIFFASARYLAANYFEDPRAILLIQLLAISFTLKSIVDTLLWGFLGLQNYLTYAALRELPALTLTVLSLLFFKLGYGYLTPALAYMFYPIIFTGIFAPLFLRTFPEWLTTKVSITKNLIKKLTSFGMPQIVTDSSLLIMGHIDTIMLTALATTSAVGLYNVAMPTAKLTMLIGEGLGIFLIPFVTELWTRNHKEQLLEGMRYIYKYFLMIALPAAALLFIYSDMILGLFFDVQYHAATMPLRVLSLGMFCFTLYYINAAILSGINKPKTNAKILTLGIGINIIGNLILIPLFNATGAAIATAAGYGVIMLLTFIVLKKSLKIQFPIKHWIQTGFWTVLGSIVLFILKEKIQRNIYGEAIVLTSIIAICYIAILFITKLIDVAEIKNIITVLGKKDPKEQTLKLPPSEE